MKLNWILPLCVFLLTQVATAELQFVGCPGVGAEYQVTIQSSVLLNKNFASANQESYIEAIKRQLHYTGGHFSGQGGDPNVKILPGPTSPEIKIIAIKNRAYGMKLQVDAIKHPDVSIDDNYSKKAIKRGFTTKADAAVEVIYQAKLPVLVCNDDSKWRPELTLHLPTDPYLAYWVVKPSKRAYRKWSHSSGKVNPCADRELVDLPHPTYFWYFWNPLNSGKDSHGKKFSCSEHYKQGIHFQSIQAKLSQKTLPQLAAGERLHHLRNKKEIRISAIFGIISPKSKTFDLSSLKESTDLTDLSTKLTMEPTHDRGSLAFINFLANLSHLMNDSKVETKSDHILITGKLTLSDKPIRLKVFFGYSDVLGSTPSQHWKHTLLGLQRDDILIYHGHSGLGENLSFENILSQNKTTKEKLVTKDSPRFQMIAIFSCYSYAYFGRDYANFRKQIGLNTDLLFTASNFTSHRGPSGLIDYLDRNISGSPKTELYYSRYLTPNDRIVMHSF